MTRKEREEQLTSREKKAQRLASRAELEPYYTVIQNTRTKYTKLVSKTQAFHYIIGRFDPVSEKFIKKVKDTWIEVGYKGSN